MQAGIILRIAGAGLYSFLFNMATQSFIRSAGSRSVDASGGLGGHDLQSLGALFDRIHAIAAIAAPRAVRRPRVLELIGIGRSHMYNLMDEKSPAFDPTFPRPFKLGKSPNSPSVWWEHSVIDWLKSMARAEEIERQKMVARQHRRSGQ